MRVPVKKWGNSLALRIPKPFAEDAEVREGTVVDLSVSKGKIVAVPLGRKKVTLRELLAKVSPRNLHGEVDTGRPAGRESWRCPAGTHPDAAKLGPLLSPGEV